MLRGDFLDDPESKFGRLKLIHAVFAMKSNWVLNWASFSAPPCFIVAAEKFITGYHSRHENSSEFEHIIFKKTTW